MINEFSSVYDFRQFFSLFDFKFKDLNEIEENKVKVKAYWNQLPQLQSVACWCLLKFCTSIECKSNDWNPKRFEDEKKTTTMI